MSTSTLFRLSGLAGIICGLVILIQRLVIDSIVTGSPLAIGPLGPILGLLVLTGAYLRQREESGILGGVAYIVGFLSMGFIAGIDFTRRYILVQLAPDVVQALFAGQLRLFFVACGVAFLTGVLLFGVSSLRAGVFPRGAILLYVVGFVPYSVPGLFPPLVVTIAQAVGGIGVIWLGWHLWRSETRAAPEVLVPATA
jgi:hypothetical protein